jgi:hypothetical protein
LAQPESKLTGISKPSNIIKYSEFAWGFNADARGVVPWSLAFIPISD